MQAITAPDRDTGVSGLTLTDLPYPHAARISVGGGRFICGGC